VPWVLVVDMRWPYREVGPTVYLGHYDRGWERDARGLKRDSNGYVAKDPYEVKLTPADPRGGAEPHPLPPVGGHVAVHERGRQPTIARGGRQPLARALMSWFLCDWLVPPVPPIHALPPLPASAESHALRSR
jgi:hypothetical protein